MEYLPIALLFVLFTLEIPVAFALILATLSYFLWINTTLPADMIFQRMIATAESFPLLAVPFFITAGTVMNYAGISSRLMAVAEVLIGYQRGGLAQANILLSTLMGGVSGSANADAAMVSKILVPQMIQRGYSPAFSAALTASAAVITPIIPPGIALILYAFMANVSVGKMFIAGYVPGILMCLFLMAAVSWISRRRRYAPIRPARAGAKEILHQLKDSFWAMVLPLGIIMGLRFGVFTPTEAGAIAILYSALVGFLVYRQLRLRDFPKIFLESVLGTSAVMLIICAASAFGYYMSWERLPNQVSELLLGLTRQPLVLMGLINLLLLFFGMFIEGTALLIILTPLLVPAVSGLGIDLVYFGIVMVVNLTLGGVTPPFGTLMFLTCSIVGIRTSDFIREVLPFLLALLAVLLLITYIPSLVTCLPHWLM